MLRTNRLRLFLLSLALLAAPVCPAAAQTNTAADIVPDDCVFFSTSLKVGAQFEALANSKAVKRILELPTVQMGLVEIKNEREFQQFMDVVNSPIGQKVKAALIDMMSTEAALYGGQGIIDLIKVMQDYQQQNMMATFGAVMTGREPKPAPVIISALLKQQEFKIPPIVWAFKVSDKEAIDELLGMLKEFVDESGLPIQIESVEIGDGNYHTIKLTGRMIPVSEDEFIEELGDAGVNEFQAEQFHEWLSNQTLAFTLGYYNDYFVVSVAADNAHLDRLGGTASLGKSDVLAPARKHMSDPNFVELSYVSEQLTSINRFDANSAMATFEQVLGPAQLFLPPGLGDRLLGDVRRLAKDIEAVTPEPSEYIQVSLWNRGYEIYGYSRSKPTSIDYSKPLSILKRAGSSPFIAIASKGASSKGGYDKLVEYAKILYGYFNDFGLQFLGEREREEIKRAEEVVIPFLGRLVDITREKFIPSVDAAQSLFVMDTKMSIRRLFADMMLPEPMPMIELGIACTLNDGKLFVEAIEDYYLALEEFAPQIARLADGPRLPDNFKIPRPAAEAADAGTKYYYPLPPFLDEAVMPHAIVDDNLLILSMSPSLTDRMLAAGSAPTSDLVDLSKPAGVACVWRPNELWNALKLWADFGMNMPGGPGEGEREMIKMHLDVALDVLGTFKGVTSRNYIDGDYAAFHVWAEFEDID